MREGDVVDDVAPEAERGSPLQLSSTALQVSLQSVKRQPTPCTARAWAITRAHSASESAWS